MQGAAHPAVAHTPKVRQHGSCNHSFTQLIAKVRWLRASAHVNIRHSTRQPRFQHAKIRRIDTECCSPILAVQQWLVRVCGACSRNSIKNS